MMEEEKFAYTQEKEWEYGMRRLMQEIVPNLFLGPYAAANKSQLENLLRNGITHIVCVHHPEDYFYVRHNFPEHFEYMGLTIADRGTENIIQHLQQVKVFLEDCFARGGKALMHGTNGISRSAALAIGYIMEKYCLTYEESYRIVQSKRMCINPNEGFVGQLKEFEPIYRARIIAQSFDSVNESIKRKRDDEDSTDMKE